MEAEREHFALTKRAIGRTLISLSFLQMADPKSQDQVLQQILASQEAMSDSIRSLQENQEAMQKGQTVLTEAVAGLQKSQTALTEAVTDLQKSQKAMSMQLVDLQQQTQSLRDGQDRLERKMDARFDDTHRLIAEIPGAVLDGVEPYVERKIQEHELRLHSGAAVPA